MAAQKPHPFASHWLIRDIAILAHARSAGPGGVLLMGDSMVEGFWWQQLGPLFVINAGYSGIWTEALQAKSQHLIRVAKPRIVVILVGTNDAKKDQTPEGLDAAEAHYEAMVASLTASRIPAILVTPPPIETGRKFTRFYLPEMMGDLSRRIMVIGQRHRLPVIDLHAALRGDEALAKPGMTVDGAHLSAKAYQLLHARLEQAVLEQTGDPSWAENWAKSVPSKRMH